ncbi:MAG: TonB-dependent receptor [Bryobacteraceae bacterium]|nr:TonB-dependent receptor [Bryobacteraceae bacterium]
MYSLPSKTIPVSIGLLLASLALPAQTGRSSISGTLYDGANGQPVRGAVVELQGGSQKTATDLDGRYRMEVAPGTYQVKFTAPNYLPATIEGVVVVAGANTDASTIVVTAASVTTVEVTETISAVAATSEMVTQERKLAAAVSDGISGQEIRSSTASDAAAAMQQVTGVSIVESGYVYVRGLGERYSATMLNNAMIPTTEPERRVVPLDLFPASLIDNIKVLKTYTPDLPGEFSGGLVQMTTIEFPNKPVFRVSGKTGMNTVTSFKPFSTHRGGRRDIFGFDDGTRQLPPNVAADTRLFRGVFTPQQLQEFGRAFDVNYELEPVASMRPQQSYSVAAGNTWGRLGLVGAITFSNSPQANFEELNFLTMSGGRPILFNTIPQFNSFNEASRLGGVLNAAYKINGSNKLIFRNTLTRDTDMESRLFRGFNNSIGSDIEATRLRWVERGLYSVSVEGDHAVSKLGNSVFHWQLAVSNSSRNEPDLRETIRQIEEGGRTRHLPLPESGLRFFNQLQDRIYEPQADWSKPFFKGPVTGVFKIGFRGTFRTRDFGARRFRFVPVRTQTINFFAPANEVLGRDNIRPDGFEIRENTRGTDTYDANMDIYGGYGMVDLALGGRWRLVGGFRVEDAAIRVETVDPLIPGAVPSIADLRNRDLLPSINAIYALTGRQNLRFGYGRTLSRPDFRELSPFDFTNVLGGFNTVGNPNLRRAQIDNFDARWEWFPGGDQVIAASFFFKDFTDPIEVTIQPTTDLRQSFLNAAGARNYGIELEFRRNLSFIHPRLRSFGLQSNFTFVESNVEIPDDLALLLTSRNRPLLGQSRFIYNIITDWARPQWRSSARFSLNSVSRRITDVGAVGLPDIFQERNNFVDFVYQYDLREDGKLSLRFTAENLLDNRYRWTQGEFVHRAFRLGRTYSFGTSFSVF